MAADGAWANAAEPEGPDGPRSPRAVAQLRQAISEIEHRLGRPGPVLLRPESAAALANAVAGLGRQLAQLEATTTDRYAQVAGDLRRLAERLDAQAGAQAELSARMAAGEAKLAARLDQAIADLVVARAEGVAARRVDPAPVRLVMTLASGAAAVAVMGSAAMLLAHSQVPPRLAPTPLTQRADLPLRPGLAEDRPASAAVVRPAPLPAPSPAQAARDSYAATAAALARGEASALPRLTGLAEAGDAQAQRHLASLYETGGPGTPRDPAAARAWTERAAQGGDRLAMHNLALFLANGEGGPRDVPQAAGWFRRAAEKGVVDSQYNLGLMYEAGQGVEKNLREAYRWFSIAANAGDLAAREKQVALERRLAAGERAGLDHDVAAFQPGMAAPAPGLALVIPPAATVADTQAMLARQGYYVGPVDGLASPALRAAASAYLHDHPGAVAAPPRPATP